MTPSESFHQLMAQGSALHEAGQAAQALASFRQAQALSPGDAQAASACAALLSELGQMQEAFDVLHAVRDTLWLDADGASNYAIAAESCGLLEQAHEGYRRALSIDPHHLRTLNNWALMAAQAGDWKLAVERLTRCRDLAPTNPTHWCNLADVQIAARRFAQASAGLADALQRFDPEPSLSVRLAIALAFDGQIEAAQSRIDKLEPAAQDLLALLEAQVEAQRLQWQAKGLTVRVEGPPVRMPVDADKITSAVSNLLSNAIRFSPPQGTVRLVLSQPPGHVRLDVFDQGPGVDRVDRDRVFEPFYRGVRQPDDAVRGTGIGLSIVQEYVQAHGGSVRLVDEGAHSFFRIDLPHAA